MTRADTDTLRKSSDCDDDGHCYRFSFQSPQPDSDDVQVSDVQVIGQSATPQAESVPQGQSAVAQGAAQDEAPETGGDLSAERTSNTDAEQYPCDDDPSYTCTAEAPTGSGVVAIHNNDGTVTIDQGNNGVDESDSQYRLRRQHRANYVIQAANGLQSAAEQENAFSLEQQLWDRGEPYTVCFDPITYTSNGETITVQPDCVVITP